MRSPVLSLYCRHVTVIDRDRLLASAKDFGDRALTAYIEDDTAVVLSHAATSLEHMSKAVLCSLHAVLLMDIKNGKLDSLVQLAGFPTKARKPQGSPYTISGTEAIRRVGELFPGIKVPQEIGKLIAIRNLTLHFGRGDKDSTRELLAAYLRLANELMDELKVPEDERWGEHTDLVDTLISKSLSEMERDIKQRFAAGKRRIASLREMVPETELDAVLKRRQAMATWDMEEGEDWVDVQCPACERDDATSIGERVSHPDVDVDVDGAYVSGGSHSLYVNRFVCGACDLRLNSSEEVQAAGVETDVDLPDVPDEGFTDDGPWSL